MYTYVCMFARNVKAINFRIEMPISKSWSALVVQLKRLSVVICMYTAQTFTNSLLLLLFAPRAFLCKMWIFTFRFVCLNAFRKCTHKTLHYTTQHQTIQTVLLGDFYMHHIHIPHSHIDACMHTWKLHVITIDCV